MEKEKTSRLYRVIKWMVKTCYPKIEVVGEENLPKEPVIFVGNHSKMNGPIAAELYAPGEHYVWCAGEMLDRKEVPAYAFQDFWSGKPKWTHPFYKFLSYLIAPLAECIFQNANTIGVYHDARVMTTFKMTVKRLTEGANVVIFPEYNAPYNPILCQFQDRFVDVARLYYKRTGKALSFVPVYIAPRLKKMYLGTPVTFRADAPMEQERQRICRRLMEEITSIARSLPAHTVIPYSNISRKHYPTNLFGEDSHEKTDG